MAEMCEKAVTRPPWCLVRAAARSQRSESRCKDRLRSENVIDVRPETHRGHIGSHRVTAARRVARGARGVCAACRRARGVALPASVSQSVRLARWSHYR